MCSTAVESLEKRLALARQNTDYDAMEVVQKTLEMVQRTFADEVCKSGVCVVYRWDVLYVCIYVYKSSVCVVYRGNILYVCEYVFCVMLYCT